MRSDEYLDLTGQLERLSVDRQFQLLSQVWPMISKTLRTATLALIIVMVGELDAGDRDLVLRLAKRLAIEQNTETPETPNPVTE